MFKKVDVAASLSKNATPDISVNSSPTIYKEPRKALLEGGNVRFEGNIELDREVIVGENFPKSYKNREIKFCNFIPKQVPHKIKCCCDSLANDMKQIFQNNNLVHFNNNQQQSRLCKILDFYLPSVPKKNRNGKIYKIDATESSILGQDSSCVRIYLYIENEPNVKSEYHVIFCDPYHLAIPSRHAGMSANNVMEREYKNNSMNNTHIGEAFKEHEIFC